MIKRLGKSIRDFFKVIFRNRQATIGLFILLFFVLMATVGASVIPLETSAGWDQRFQPPSFQHILGTDFQGADVFAQAVHGSRDVLTLGAVPTCVYGTPSTEEIPDSLQPYLQTNDAFLLKNHGALTVGSDVITAYYRMESLELWAKITINAIILGGSYDIDRKNIDKLINLRSYYKITGKHPGYRKFERREKGEPTDK